MLGLQIMYVKHKGHIGIQYRLIIEKILNKYLHKTDYILCCLPQID